MPLGLSATLSGHPREIHARHRARSPRTRGSFVVLLRRIDDGGPGGVHGIGNGTEVTRVQVGVGPQEDRRIVAEHVLGVAHRFDHRTLCTGHLFLAVVENAADEALEIRQALPEADQIAAEVREAMEGSEPT